MRDRQIKAESCPFVLDASLMDKSGFCLSLAFCPSDGQKPVFSLLSEPKDKSGDLGFCHAGQTKYPLIGGNRTLSLSVVL